MWTATPRQSQFLKSSAYEALYGGAAGGGKSEALLAGALRWATEPHFRALILRRTYADLERSLIDRSRTMFRKAFPDADYHETKKTWRFPSGAQVQFGHLEHEEDKFEYQSAEYSYVAFDELTHFSETQYTYLTSRARSSHGLPIRIRAATNPGGRGHEWVMRRWAPWLDPRSEQQAAPGEKLFYENGPDGETWVDVPSHESLSRVFIPANISDNPHLTESDPTYVSRLRGLDRVTRAQLLEGDWLARVAEGALFKSAWFDRVAVAPAQAFRVRYWDRASTPESEAKSKGRDADYTVGVRIARTSDGLLFVEDVVRFRGRPMEVEDTIVKTAKADGKHVMVGIEQDPGSAGVAEADAYMRALCGFNARKVRPTGNKVQRAQPASAQCEARNVKLVQAPWNKAFTEELEQFPDGNHDDQVDAFSGAFTLAAAGEPPHLRDLDKFREIMRRYPRRW